MPSIFKAVDLFHRKVLGMVPPCEPTRLSDARKRWALHSFHEEIKEFTEAETLEEEVDALTDLMYFCAGRLVEMGIDGDTSFREVNEANMLKKRGALSKRPDSLGFDAVKPEGWQPPVLSLRSTPVPRIIVTGYAQHGKDTFCEILRDKYKLKYEPSSLFCAEKIIMPVLGSVKGYQTAEECFNDRGNVRPEWFALIRAYLKDNKAKLGEAIFEDNDIYCGIRDKEELEAVIASCQPAAVVWVNRLAHVKPEPIETCNVSPFCADYFVDNNGDLADLECEADKFMETLYKTGDW